MPGPGPNGSPVQRRPLGETAGSKRLPWQGFWAFGEGRCSEIGPRMELPGGLEPWVAGLEGAVAVRGLEEAIPGKASFRAGRGRQGTYCRSPQVGVGRGPRPVPGGMLNPHHLAPGPCKPASLQHFVAQGMGHQTSCGWCVIEALRDGANAVLLCFVLTQFHFDCHH